MKQWIIIAVCTLLTTGLFVQDAAAQLSNWELYLAISTTGGGGGAKYRRGNPEISMKTFSLEITGVKGDNEFTAYDIYGYPQKYNQTRYIVLIPMTFGYHKRVFADKIEDNIRPFYNIELGPVLGLRFPVGHGFGGNIQRGTTGITAGGFVGVGVEFIQAGKNSFILAAGYRLATFPKNIVDERHFNAFMIRFGILTRP